MPLIYLNEDSIVAASAALLLVTKKDDFMGGPTLGELVNIERALAELQQTTAAHTTPHEPPVPPEWTELHISNALGRGQSVLKHKAIALCLRIVNVYEATIAAQTQQISELEAELAKANAHIVNLEYAIRLRKEATNA